MDCGITCARAMFFRINNNACLLGPFEVINILEVGIIDENGSGLGVNRD